MRIPSRLLCFLLVLAMPAMGADDPVRSTQEELRRRNIYFGDIDGRRSDEYSEAVRRYQKRKGLAVSGTEDHDTLRSLGLLPRSPNEPPPKELDWPAEPVLKSDTHLNVIAAANELGNETGVAPADVAGPASTPGPQAPHTQGKAHGGGAVPASRPPAAPPAPAPEGQPVQTRSKFLPPRLSFRNSGAIPAQLSDFVTKYVHAVGHNELRNELQFYADRVNYFGHQQVDRRIVEETLRKYYQRWPKRSYSISGPLSYRLAPAHGEIVVSYRLNFSLGNGKTRVKGQTDNRLTINAATADPRIVAIAERRVR